jgi:Mn2+/Fe2+ NRAMP family transporter
MRKLLLIAAVLLSLPVLLHVYQPSMQLGGLGLALGVIGMTVSPVILFGALAIVVCRGWGK